MTIAINDKDSKTVAILDVSNHDEDFAAVAELGQDAAWRWWTLDPQMGEICALVTLYAYDYELRVLYHPMDAMVGKPVSTIPGDAVTYTLPVAFDAAELQESIDAAHAYYADRA